MLLGVAEKTIGVILPKLRAKGPLHLDARRPHGRFEERVALREGALTVALASRGAERRELIVGGVASVGVATARAASAFELAAQVFVGPRAEADAL